MSSTPQTREEVLQWLKHSTNCHHVRQTESTANTPTAVKKEHASILECVLNAESINRQTLESSEVPLLT